MNSLGDLIMKYIVKTLGLQSLKGMLANDRGMFEDYYEFLLESFNKGDNSMKVMIAEIFAEYSDKKNIEQIVNTIVNTISALGSSASAAEASDSLIQLVLAMCSKNYYSNIEDCEWFISDVLKSVIPKIKKENTLISTLNTLLVKITANMTKIDFVLIGFYSSR